MTDISFGNGFATRIRRPRPVVSVARVLQSVVERFAAAGREHRKRMMLAELLAYEDHRLTDLGISRQDIVEALRR